MLRKHFPANIRVNMMEDVYGDQVDVYIVKYGANGASKKVLQLRGDEDPSQRHFWTDVEEGQELPSPTFRIRRSDWGLVELFRALTEEHRNTPPDRDAEFKVLQRHLQDVRALLFQALGAEDPQRPLIVNSHTTPVEAADMLAEHTGRIVIGDDILANDGTT